MDIIKKFSVEVVNSLELQHVTEYKDTQLTLMWYKFALLSLLHFDAIENYLSYSTTNTDVCLMTAEWVIDQFWTCKVFPSQKVVKMDHQS